MSDSDNPMTYDDEVHNMSLLPLVYFAIEKGIPSAVLKAEIGVDVSTLDSSGFKLTVNKYKRLIELTKEYTGLVHPGLHVGNRMSIKSLGILGYVMASCNSLGEAVQKFYEYNRISQNVGTFYLKIKIGRAH
ncbi:MAG: AraC family transcriptional regulator ligand-binding domain-containing protein, partial [bacterium]